MSGGEVHDMMYKKSFTVGKVKHSGTFKGKSNALGQGGRAAQLKARGVPGGVIGMMARKVGAAPGGPNYHKKAKKAGSTVGTKGNVKRKTTGLGGNVEMKKTKKRKASSKTSSKKGKGVC